MCVQLNNKQTFGHMGDFKSKQRKLIAEAAKELSLSELVQARLC